VISLHSGHFLEKVVSAADANRRFSELLRGVKKGHSYLVTSHGQPVAKIVPIEKNGRTTSTSRTILLRRLKSERTIDVGRWSRSELYESEK
jgi:prevent-host-death family protein